MKNFIIFLAMTPAMLAAEKKYPFEIERDLWLKAHNEVRDEVGTQPLIWDMKLKRMAKKWALKLVDECKKNPNKIKLTHSPNRGDIGENLAATWGLKHPVSIAVENWAKEKKWYDPEKNECNPRDSSGKPMDNRSCGHYTQVVAWRSLRLGCAKATCPGKQNITYYVCNYEPHGNMRGVHPIKRGE